MNDMKDETEEKQSLYSVSLVYSRQTERNVNTLLRVLITEARSKEEAMGIGIKNFDEEMKDHVLLCKVVIEINNTKIENK